MKQPDGNPMLVLAEVARILAEHEIRYVLVGSLASSTHGMYRATADIDILADIKPKHIYPLLKALEDHFYVDESAIREAVDQRRSFNAIHFDSVFKIDIFIPKADEFAMMQLDRGEPRKLLPDSDQIVYVATAEDTILAKLRWYRQGGEISLTQWSDVIGIIAAVGKQLDEKYLEEWARKLGVTDLLERVTQEATQGSE